MINKIVVWNLKERKIDPERELFVILDDRETRSRMFWYYDTEGPRTYALRNMTANAKLFHAHRQKSLPTTCETPGSPPPPPPTCFGDAWRCNTRSFWRTRGGAGCPADSFARLFPGARAAHYTAISAIIKRRWHASANVELRRSSRI